jgi:hypothetical protein
MSKPTKKTAAKPAKKVRRKAVTPPPKKTHVRKRATKKAAKKTRSTLNKKIHKVPGTYLSAAALLLLSLFEKAGYEVPTKKNGDLDFTVGLGFPSKKATAAKNQRIGEAWSDTMVSSGQHAIIISQAMPVKTKEDRIQMLGILLHEMIHVTVGLKCGHKGAFRACALALGLAGKMTATFVDKDKPGLSGLHSYLGTVADALGAAPWGMIDTSKIKPQGTRMLRCKCVDCGFLFRASSRWVWGSEETGPREGGLQCPDPSCGGQIERDGDGL